VKVRIHHEGTKDTKEHEGQQQQQFVVGFVLDALSVPNAPSWCFVSFVSSW